MTARRLIAVGLAVALGGALSLGMAASALAAEPPPNNGRAAQQEQPDQACRGLGRLAPRCVAQGVGQGVSSALGGVGSALSTSIFQQLYEWVVGGATWLLRRLVSAIDSSTRPDLLSGWFGAGYRLMISLATLLVLPVLLIATISAVIRQDWSGLVKSYFVYLPMAAIGTAMAIPLTDMGLDITDWMSGLFLSGMRGDIQAFLDTAAAALTESSAGQSAMGAGMPLFLAFLAAIVIALGAFAVWVELVLRSAGIYVAVFFLPLGFAALVWPHTRAWFGRLTKTVVALILSKFVIVAVLALAAAALSNVGGGSAGEVSQVGRGATAAAAVELTSAGDSAGGFPAVIAGAALMLMAAFSPLVLFRVADVAGGEMATAFAGVTQGRTSPIRVPDSHSAARMYSRVMNGRPQAGAGVSAGGAGAASGTAGVGATAGMAAGDGELVAGGHAAGGQAPGGGQAAGGQAAGVPGSDGRAGGERPGGQATPQGAAPNSSGEVQAPAAARQPGAAPPSGPAHPASGGVGQSATAPALPAPGSGAGAAPPQGTPSRPADTPYVPDRQGGAGRE